MTLTATESANYSQCAETLLCVRARGLMRGEVTANPCARNILQATSCSSIFYRSQLQQEAGKSNKPKILQIGYPNFFDLNRALRPDAFPNRESPFSLAPLLALPQSGPTSACLNRKVDEAGFETGKERGKNSCNLFLVCGAGAPSSRETNTSRFTCSRRPWA